MRKTATSGANAAPKGAAKAHRKPKLKTYRVLYAVTRSEWYEIEAPNKATALFLGFLDGRLVDTGDSSNVEDCYAEEVTAAEVQP